MEKITTSLGFLSSESSPLMSVGIWVGAVVFVAYILNRIMNKNKVDTEILPGRYYIVDHPGHHFPRDKSAYYGCKLKRTDSKGSKILHDSVEPKMVRFQNPPEFEVLYKAKRNEKGAIVLHPVYEGILEN